MLLSALRWAARLPLSWLHKAGTALGWTIYAASPVYAGRLRENLYASGIASDAAAKRALLHRVIAETGKGVTELIKIWFCPEAQITRLARCETWALAEEAARAGRGIIFLTPHLGCFEIAGLYIAQRTALTIMYRPPKLKWVEPLMVAGRQRGQARLAPANLRGVRMLYKALQRGEAVGLLPDQTPGVGEGAWADFFGRPAYTMTLVSRLQRTTGAAVILVYAERLAAGRGYHLHMQPLATQHLDESALNRAIEGMVRRRPDQYLWSYNRYKVPPGAPPTASARREALR